MDNYSGAGSAQGVLRETQGAEEVAGTNTHKFLWISFFGIIFVVIIVSLFFLFSPKDLQNTGEVSEKELMDGATVASGENESVKFKFGDEDHNINIDFVGLDSVGITIRSEPIQFVLKINEVKQVDLNNDDIYDIRVKLVKIEDGKATIAVKKIEIEVCNGVWSCSSWTECSNGKQTRVCKDLNDCGSVENKPFTEKNCIEIVFIENDSYFEDNISLNNTIVNNSNVSNSINHTNITISNNHTNITLYNRTNNTDISNSTNNTIVNNETNSTSANNLTNTSYISITA
jgi:hypothetical protein